MRARSKRGGRHTKWLVRVEKLYAWLVVDEDGTEGIPAIIFSNHVVPTVGGKQSVVEHFREKLLADPAMLGKRLALVRFTQREDIESFIVGT